MTTLIGSVVAYGSVVDQASPPPEGWLLCDGRPVSREGYRDLFDVIGTLHGSGDGVTTFNLPDYRGRFQRGVDDGVGVDPDATSRLAPAVGGASGDRVGSVQGDGTAVPTGEGRGFVTTQNGGHRHDVQHLPTGGSWYSIAGSHYAEWTNKSSPSSPAGKHTHTVNGGGDLETTPKSIYVHYLVACGDVAPGTL
jgi:phage-related tail fiber protein